MIEKIGHIKNPLTVIAMFAGLAEVSGTIILPFIASNTQQIFVWFLMIFPCLLVTAFFGTLLFNHVVLYAPSDYRDDKSFSDSFKSVKPSTRAKKISDEIEEEIGMDSKNNEDENKESSSSTERKSHEHGIDKASKSLKSTFHDIYAKKAFFAEEYAITWLEQKLNIEFQRGARIKQMPRVVFDAVSINSARQYIVEVRYLSPGMVMGNSIELMFCRVERFSRTLQKNDSKNIVFYIIIVVDKDIDISRDEKIKLSIKKLKNIACEFEITSDIEVINLP